MFGGWAVCVWWWWEGVGEGENRRMEVEVGVFGSTCFASLTSILAAIIVFPSFRLSTQVTCLSSLFSAVRSLNNYQFH